MDSPTSPARVVAYIRKSSQDNDDGEATKQQNSLKYQRDFLEVAIKRHTLELVHEPFWDDETGYQAFIRDGFDAMLKYLKDHEGEIDGIVCTEISRLARNFGDGGMVLWYMQCGIIKQIFTYSKTFTNCSSDQMMVAIEFAMSKKSSDENSDRTLQGMRSKAHTLKHPARVAVLGYRTEGRPGAKKWVIDEIAGPLVRQVFEQFATGKFTFDEIAEYAYDIGLRSTDRKSKTNKYSKNTWRNRLRDIQYTGIFVHEGERIVGAYEPLITTELFHRVQEIMRDGEHPKEKHIDYAYSNQLIKCGRCGGWLSGQHQKGITYYRCSRRKLPCKDEKLPYIPEKEVERTLKEAFEKFEINQETWLEARDYVIELNQPQRSDLKQQVLMLNGKIDNEKKLQISWGRQRGLNELSQVEYDRLMQDSYQAEASLKRTIAKCEDAVHLLNELMNQFLDNIKFITQRLEIALPVNKRELVTIFCENLIWKDEKLRWDWKKAYFVFINQPQSSTMLPDVDSNHEPSR